MKGECVMKKRSIDAVKILGIIGTGLGVVATVLGNYSQEKEMKKTVAEEVAKALADSKN